MPEKLSLAKGMLPRALHSATVTPVNEYARPWGTGRVTTIATRTRTRGWDLPTGQAHERVLVDGVLVRTDQEIVEGEIPLPANTYQSPTFRAKQAQKAAGCRNVAYNPPLDDEEVKYVPVYTNRDRRDAVKRDIISVSVDAGDVRLPKSVMAMTVRPAGLANPPARSPLHKTWIDVG